MQRTGTWGVLQLKAMAKLNDRPVQNVRGHARDGVWRVLGWGEDPRWWSVRVLSLPSIEVRIHATLLLWAVGELAASVSRGNLGAGLVLRGVAAFLACVLVREAARLWWARRWSSTARDVVLWPLGGLAEVSPARSDRPILAECGGLFATAILVAMSGAAVWLLGGGVGAMLFNPFAPGVVLGGLRSEGLLIAWWVYYASSVLLALNLLLPMAPMDLFRVLRASADGSGRARSRRRGLLRVGLITAMAVFVFAAASDQVRLMAVAVLGAIATWLDCRRLDFLEPARPAVELPVDDPMESVGLGPPAPSASNPSMSVPKKDDPAELDRILAKISREGMASLTNDERATLRRETERRSRG